MLPPNLSPLPMPDRAVDPEAARFLFHSHGKRVLWYRALPCPCRNTETGTYSRNCALLSTLCNGNFLYELQTLPDTARVHFYGAKKQVEDAQLGLILKGELMAEAMPDEVPFERGDKLVVLDWLYEFREARTRGETALDAITQTFPAVVDYVGAVLNGGFVRVANEAYTVDYDAFGKGSIRWLSDALPPGTNYTTVYRYHPTVWVDGSSLSSSAPSYYPGPPGRDGTEGALPAPSHYGGPVRGRMSLKHPSDYAPAQ